MPCPDRARAEAHWHAASTPAWRHDGAAWGRAVEGGWAWLLRDHGRWWTVAGGVQRMVRHGGFWWWRTRDGWFLLHEGEPWAHRLFADLGRYGILHPPSGLRVVYGAGGRRMAVLWPEGRWLLLDARTGAELARGAFPAKKSLEYAISP